MCVCVQFFFKISTGISLKVLREKSSLILQYTDTVSASRPDEVNCNVHETLALNNGSKHGDNSKTSQHLYNSLLYIDLNNFI